MVDVADTAIDCKTAAVIVRFALPVVPDEPVTPLDVAVITVFPGSKVVARPVELIVALAVEEELQVGD